MKHRIVRNELTEADQLFLYLEHTVIEADWIKEKDVALARLLQHMNSVTYMHAFATLYGIPLWDTDGTKLWVIWAE